MKQESDAVRKLHTLCGYDNRGREYASPNQVWGPDATGSKANQEKLYEKKNGWYGKALNYWENTPATVSGVLGGIEYIHDIDIKGSAVFLKDLSFQRNHALDCGSGIGRITENLLLPILEFEKVDLLEPVKKMMDEALKRIPSEKLGTTYLTSMELFVRDKAVFLQQETQYDLIVIQWCAIYLTDEDFVAFFKFCKSLLAKKGVIFFKENCVVDGSYFIVDKNDNSLTRSDIHYKLLFEQASLSLIKEGCQDPWPDDLLTVKMYALQ